MPKLSKELALSAIAQEVQQSQPDLVELLKESGLAGPMDSVQSLRFLSPDQANFLRMKFGKAPIEAHTKPQGFAPDKSTAPIKAPEKPKVPVNEGFKTVESFATEVSLKPAEVSRIINIVKLSCGIDFEGRIDANWEFFISEVRSKLAPEYGGKGDKSPEAVIGEMQVRLKGLDAAIDSAGEQAIASDDSFAVDVLGGYLGAVSDDNSLEHDAVIDSFTSNVAAQLRQKYDRNRIKRMAAMKFAIDLAGDAERLHERNAAQSSLGWQERVNQLKGTAQRVTAIALAPVSSNKRNAASVFAAIESAAIAASNRP